MFHHGNWSSSCPRCRVDVHPTKTGHGAMPTLVYTGSSPAPVYQHASGHSSDSFSPHRLLSSITDQCKFLLPPSTSASTISFVFTHDDSFIQQFSHFLFFSSFFGKIQISRSFFFYQLIFEISYCYPCSFILKSEPPVSN